MYEGLLSFSSFKKNHYISSWYLSLNNRNKKKKIKKGIF